MNSISGRLRLLAAVPCMVALAACNLFTSGGAKGDFAPAPAPNVVLTGNISGLSSRPIVLENNGTEARSFAGTSTLSFGAVQKGAAYNVTIKEQPYGRTCTIANNTGTANEDVRNIAVTCQRDPAVPDVFISGTVDGLVAGATGLRAKLTTEEGEEIISIASGQTSIAFSRPLLPNFPYEVTIENHPVANDVAHSCGVVNGTGNMPAADVANVIVRCSFTIGGTAAFPLVFGTAPAINAPGVGLSLGSFGAPPLDTVNVTTPSFAFANRQLSTASANYTVTITSQPPGQTCVLRSGGSSANVALTTPANVTSLGLACTNNPAPANELTGTYKLDGAAGREFLTFFSNGTFIYGAHAAAGSNGVEHGIYGVGAFGPGTLVMSVTTDSSGANGISDAAVDGGFINGSGFTKGPGTLSFVKNWGGFGGVPAQTRNYAMTAVNSTAGQLTGAWTTADAFRVFVYDGATGAAYHGGMNGAANIQDLCLSIADPLAATGSYTQDRGASCTATGGVVDTDPFAAFGGFYGLPGAPAAPPGSPPGTPATASPVNYAVTAGAPDTLALQSAFGPINWSRSTPN